MNWNGWKVVVGPGKGPFFLNEIQGRRTLNKSNIIVVTGPPGEGKTYCALALGEILDHKFSVNIQVAFERSQLLHLIGDDSPLKRGQVIVVDEAHYAMGNRRWYEEIQIDLMENIESVRSRGYIIIIVALHLHLLDVIIRKYVLSYMIHLEQRGLGIWYRLYTPRFEADMHKKRRGKLRLPLPDVDKCDNADCLECKYRDKCITSRAVYERLKKAFTGKRTAMAEEKLRHKEKVKIKNEKIVEMLHKHKEEFVLTTHHKVDLGCIQILVDKYLDTKVGLPRCRTIRTLYGMTYKEKEKSQKK